MFMKNQIATVPNHTWVTDPKHSGGKRNKDTTEATVLCISQDCGQESEDTIYDYSLDTEASIIIYGRGLQTLGPNTCWSEVELIQ